MRKIALAVLLVFLGQNPLFAQEQREILQSERHADWSSFVLFPAFEESYVRAATLSLPERLVDYVDSSFFIESYAGECGRYYLTLFMSNQCFPGIRDGDYVDAALRVDGGSIYELRATVSVLKTGLFFRLRFSDGHDGSAWLDEFMAGSVMRLRIGGGAETYYSKYSLRGSTAALKRVDRLCGSLRR